MKTDSLIAQIVPVGKPEQKTGDQAIRRDRDTASSSRTRSFSDFLQPQMSSASAQKLPRPVKRDTAPPAPIPAPASGERQTPAPKPSETTSNRNDQTKTSLAKTSSPVDQDRFEQRQQLRNESTPVNKKTSGSTTDQVPSKEETAIKSTMAKGLRDIMREPSGLSSETVMALQQVMGNSQELVADFPVLAILTGKLEYVDPQSIPSVVSHSEFIQQAFGAQEIPEFLSTPQSLEATLRHIGVTDQDIQELASHGVDLGALVSPAHLLQHLGFDPQRISHEMQILKENITTKVGLSPYITRAERLQGTKANAPTQVGPTDEQAQPATLPVASPTTNISQPAQPAQPTVSAPQTSEAPTLQNNVMVQQQRSTQGQGIMSMISPETASPNTLEETSQTITAPNALPIQTPKISSAIAAQIKPQFFDAANAPVPELMQQNIPQDIPSFSFQSTDQELFSNFGQNLEFKNVSDILAHAETTNPEALEDIATALAAELEGMIDLQNKPQPSPTTSFMQRDTGAPTLADLSPVIETEEFTQNPYTEDLYQASYGQEASYTSMANPENLLAANLDKNPMAKASIQQNTLERLAVTAEDFSAVPKSASHQSGNESFSGEGQQEREPQTPSTQQTSTLTMGHLNEAGRSDKFAKHLSLETHHPATSKIIERARMMVKDGGGEVILDLGGSDLGKIELALQVQGNKVDLRIIAASEQARELLTQDISTLREALAIQDLDLSEVEVAVSGQSTSSGEGWQEQQSSFASDSRQESSNGHYLSSRSESAKRTTTIRRPIPTRSMHNGQIQVQV